jgi:hypothetical protein
MAVILDSNVARGILIAIVVVVIFVITAALLTFGLMIPKIVRWLSRLATRAPKSVRDSSKPVSPDYSKPVDLSSVRPVSSLKKLQKRGVGASLPPEFAQGVEQRLDELIKELTQAHEFLVAGGAGALGAAANKIVRCRHLTGLEWRKHLAVSGSAAQVGVQIGKAFVKDVEPLVNVIARLLAAQPPPVLANRDGSFALMCAACGESAVTFRAQNGNVSANSISNVNSITVWDGEMGRRLAELLEGDSARAVLDYLGSPECRACPAYCPECGRVYCREHYAVEEDWSDSWYTAGYATCPLGHQREFE